MTWAAAAVLPALLVSALTIGCGGDNKSEKTSDSKADKGSPKAGGTGGSLTAVDSKATGTLKGKVKFVGTRPNVTKENELLLDAMKKKDMHCVEAGAKPEEKEQQTWRIAEDGGLGNVFVWLAPPAGKFFKVDEANYPKGEVVLDQPHCAFIPHAFVLCPKVRDPAKPKEFIPTGQTLLVKNSAEMAHNTKLEGGDDNPGGDNAIPAGKSLPPMALTPSPAVVTFKCGIHPWMSAYARVFDHPYAAVTDKDGNYEIKNVPAGAEVHLVVWHEAAGYADGKDGKTVTLKPEVNTENFEIKAK